MSTRFRVAVQTGDVRWASTDANVTIQFIGTIATTLPMPLDNSADNFERGNLDKFDLPNVDDVGWINEVKLKHDRDGIGDGWYVDWVQLTDLDHGIVYSVPFDRWLATDEGDNKTEATKPVEVGPISLDQGVINTYYIGYRPLRKENQTNNSPLTFNEQMTWQEMQGASVKDSEATSLELGAELGASFLGEGGKFTAKVTETVTSETGAQTSSTVTGQQTVTGVVPPGEDQTWVLLLYQEVLEGVGEGNGISVPWESRYPGHADVMVLNGWLSDQAVAEAVRQKLESQSATSGGDPVPAVVQPDGMQLRISTRSLAAITPTSVKTALEENEHDRHTVASNATNMGGTVVIHP